MAGVTISLHGEYDIATAPALSADLQSAIESSDADIVVDCTHLTFIDSSGVRVLVEGHGALEAQGRQLHIVNIGRERRVFEILGLAYLLRDDLIPQ
jgi:anti-anti-sigma factor